MIHLLEYVGNMPNGEGITVCGEKVPGQEVTRHADDASCPYCLWEWLKRNISKIPNVPTQGHPLVHWVVVEHDGYLVASCDILTALDTQHILASKSEVEVTCEDCRTVIEETKKRDK